MDYCLLASTVDVMGVRRLESSDRAAVHFALQSDPMAIAICPSDDSVAHEFAIACGVQSVLAFEASRVPEFRRLWAGIGFTERIGEKLLAQWADRRAALLLFDVLSCTLNDSDKEHHTILCDAGRGARDELLVRGPCVLVVGSSVSRTPYVSRHRRHRAQPKTSRAPLPTRGSPDAPVWSPVRPRARARQLPTEVGADRRTDEAFAIDASSSSSSQPLLVADADTCAQHLVRYLAHHGFLAGLRGNITEIQPVAAPAGSPVERRPQSSRSLSPAVQRRPRWLDSTGSSSRGPFWCDVDARAD